MPGVSIEAEFPVVGVQLVVMAAADRAEIDQVGVAVMLVFDQVVLFAAVEGHVAAGEQTGAMHRAKRQFLIRGGEPPVAAVVQHGVTELIGRRHAR